MAVEGSSLHPGKLSAEQVWREPGHRSVDTGWPIRHEVDRAAPHTPDGSPARQEPSKTGLWECPPTEAMATVIKPNPVA